MHCHDHDASCRGRWHGARGRSDDGRGGFEEFARAAAGRHGRFGGPGGPGGFAPGGFPGFGRGEGGRGGPGGPGGEIGRFFAHGDLRLVILQLIAEAPRTGYDLIKAIEARVGGAYSPSPGTVYPTLTWIEESGFSTVSPGEGSRKEHAITDEGRAFLDANRRAVDALFARMDEAAGAAEAVPAPVLRAMEGLRFALQLRLRRGGPQGALTPDQAAAIAAALDAATQAVERS